MTMHVKPPLTIAVVAASDTETLYTETGIMTRLKFEVLLLGMPERWAVSLMAGSTLSDVCDYYVIVPRTCSPRPHVVRV